MMQPSKAIDKVPEDDVIDSDMDPVQPVRSAPRLRPGTGVVDLDSEVDEEDNAEVDDQVDDKVDEENEADASRVHPLINHLIDHPSEAKSPDDQPELRQQKAPAPMESQASSTSKALVLSEAELVRDRYESVYPQKGLIALLKVVLADEIRDFSTLEGFSLEELLSFGYLTLIFTHAKVLSSVISVSIVQDWHTDPELRNALATMRNHQREKQRPAIYLYQLADGRGSLPTTTELLDIIRCARSYMYAEDTLYINAVDSQHEAAKTARPAEPGHRKYMYSKDSSGRLHLNGQRQKKTLGFLQALEKGVMQHLPTLTRRYLDGFPTSATRTARRSVCKITRVTSILITSRTWSTALSK